MEQLRKTKANISFWGLLEASTRHRQALQEALNTIQVSTGITHNALVHTIAQIRRPGFITFIDDNLPPEGRNHNKAFYITIGWENALAQLVLMDNGSCVNICPLKTLQKMMVNLSYIVEAEESCGTVRGFDGGEQFALWEITLEIWVGPLKTQAVFLVMNIQSSFNMLLGCPWMHKNRICASLLHRKIKLEMGCKEVIVHGDKGRNEIRANQVGKNMAPVINNYTEVDACELKSNLADHQAFPHLFNYKNRNVPDMLKKNQFFPGMGLGVDGEKRIAVFLRN
ncbi:hypothetical protein MKW92_030585 [Papaver armeniacum]|nr:hypothetical protein MKW92_030585 [Papaver armeniacum]